MSRFVLTAQLQLQAPNNVAQVVRQIQNQLNGVTVNLQVQGAAQAQRQIQQVTQSTNRATTAAERMGRAFAVSLRRFAAFSIATRAVGLFTSTLSDAIQTSIDFERQLIKVSQVTGKSLGQLRGLTKQITSLSTGLGVASSDLLNISTILAQAGLSAQDTSVALKTLAKAALAPNFDSMSETAEGAIAILAQFKEGVGSLEKQLGSINAVAGAFAVEASDLIDVVRRTGGVFKSSGGSLNELLALFTSVRATTRESAESIGTGLRTIFTRIQRPKTIEFLKQFGVELVDLEGKFVGPYEAIKRLSEALSGLGERDITFIKIAEELGGFRQIGKVLPLLQQFSTAQQALNVAMKAGDSLTSDAASAQAALAIRIIKVKEEFLALVRSITETSTFQAFANTALSLASALIKLADSIKPLLPLLGAMAAIRLTKGIGGFLGGVGGGLSSGRTFSQGGVVRKFARGGMVPGTGNSDTVPAMLMPGEFVIRKSSVNKLGAGNLAAMNENRFALGGQARKFGVASLLPMNKPIDSVTGNIPISQIRKDLLRKAGSKSFIKRGNLKNVDDTIRGILGLKGQESIKTSAISETISNQDAASEIQNEVNLSIKKLIDNAASTLGNKLQISVDKKADDATVRSVGSASTIGSIFEGALSMLGAPMDASKGEQDPIDFPSGLGPKFAKVFQSLTDIPVDAKRTATRKILKDTATRKASAYLANAVYGDARWQSIISSQAPSTNIDKNKSYTLKQLGMTKQQALAQGFRGVGGLYKAERKYFGGMIHKFATGGGVGTDTVPALLTPGEFVVNRSAAQRIGYGNLNRMNKVGKYANGGIVQQFENGTGTSGVKAPTMVGTGGTGPGQNFVPLNMLTQQAQALSQAQKQQRQSIVQTIAANKMAIGATSIYMLQGFLPALEDNNTAITRVSHGLLELVAKVATVGLALEAFGVQLNAKNILDFFGSGPNSAGGLLQRGLQAGMPKISNALGSARSFVGNAGGKFSSTLGGLAGNVSNSIRGSNFAKGISAGFSGKSVIGGGSKSLMGNLGGFIGQAGFKAGGLASNVARIGGGLVSSATQTGGGIKRGLIAGFQGGRFGQSGSDIAATLASRGVGKAGQAAAQFANVLGKGVTVIPKLLGPMLGVAAAAYGATEAFKVVIGSIYNFDGRLKSAIEAGNINKATQVANEKASFEGANVVRGGGATAGAIAGMILGGPIGAAIGAGLGAAAGTLIANMLPEGALDTLNVMFGGNTRSSAVALAAAQASAVKTQKELDAAQKIATNAMEDFEKGSISASDALSKIRAASSGVSSQESRASNFAKLNLQNRSTGGFAVARDIFTLGGLLGETSSQRNQRLGKESADQINQASKFRAEAFQMETGARTESIRSNIARGKSKTEIENEALGDLQDQKLEKTKLAQKLLKSGDEEGYQAAMDAAKQYQSQIDQVNREIENLNKEVARSKAAFDAMNLGLRNASATSSAMSATMDKFAASFEVGGSTFVSNTEFLSKAVTSAAQAMNPDEIKQAVSDVSKNLSEMGVSSQYTAKFEQNTAAFVEAQQNYNQAFKNIKNKIGENAFKGLSAEELKKKFGEEISGLMGPDVSEDAKKNLKAVVDNLELSSTEVDQIIAGNFEVFGNKLGEAGQKQFEEIMKIAQERQKAEQVLIGFIKQRAEAERNLVAAQKEAVDLLMEGREVQAKYGGPAVSYEEKRSAIIDKANAGASGAGVGEMRTGSIAELRQRNAQIALGASNIEQKRRIEGGMSGSQGVKDEIVGDNLKQAQKDQVQTIRDLIKLEEEQLKITQEKNKLEKQSMESLINGDIEKFFDQQAAVGATAAIATGNKDLMNAFGATALAGAYSDIERQKEAGVQEIYGQRIEGPGGLGEQAAGAALAARGVQNPMAARMLAGTTPEEEASKARLRELGGVLGETGQLGVDMAQMEANTAEIRVTQATIKLEEVTQKGKEAAERAAGMKHGGIVYASRGVFVPRGTDTVPAMLTPGEFVVRREAVSRGNNLQLLEAMNNGISNSAGAATGTQALAAGGRVRYLAEGGMLNGIVQNILGTDVISSLTKALTTFTSQMADNIKSLQDTKFKVTLDSTNVNVNLTGNASMLGGLTQEVKNEIAKQVSEKIKGFSVGNGGKLVENSTTLPK